jgi:rhodanese-related sulfurtransferase
MKLLARLLPLCVAPAVSMAQIQVVGDDACPKFAVDIAAFATCDGDRVSRAASEPAMVVAAIPPAEVPPNKRTDSELYVSAAEARRLRRAYPGQIVLVDIRSHIEAAYVGQPDTVDIHVPYLAPERPPGDTAVAGIRLRRNPAFVDGVKAALARLDGPAEPTVLLLCRSGRRSAIAADALMAAGVARVYSIVDGFEGDLGASGRRDVNGWKNAGGGWRLAQPAAPSTLAAAR